jgi:hypothetical protein
MNGWVLRDPAWLAAWILVALLWWRARQIAPARPEWTGALALWKRVPGFPAAAGAHARERARLSWAARLALMALVFGVLALAHPSWRAPASGAGPWTLVLDRSPAMFLPVDLSPAARLRIDVAVDRAVLMCEENGLAPASREWLAQDWNGVQRARGARPPQAWLERDAGEGSRPPWGSHDSAASVWVSDCAVQPPPLFAGVVLSGAAVIPGPVADLGAQCWLFDGARLQAAPWPAPRSGLRLHDALPEAVLTLARLWAQARELPLSAVGQPALLELSGPAVLGAPIAGRVSRPAWSAPAAAMRAAMPDGFRAWASFRAADGASTTAVSWRPGRIALAFQQLSAGDCDPAAFALDWAELFDQACLPERGVVPLAARLREGAASARAPALSASLVRAEERSLASGLALLACSLALAGAALSASQGRLGAKDPARRVRSAIAGGLR